MSQRSPFKTLALILPVLAVPMLALAGCDGAAKTAADTPPRPVLAATIHYENLKPDRSFVGVIRPRIEAELGFRVGGKVAQRFVEVGQWIEPGEKIAALDETDLRLQADQAEAEKRAATGALSQAAAAEIRAKALHAKGWATDALTDQAKAAADEARARLLRAERAVELTHNALTYAILRAETRGVVTAALIDPGQVVASGQTAIKAAQAGEKEVVVSLPESFVEKARHDMARVSLWSAPDKTYAATLRELSPAADPATRTFLAKFTLPEAGDSALLGMTATLTLSDAANERVARAPLSALFSQGAGPAVFVVEGPDGALKLRPVTVKAYEADDVLISGGVEEGAQIVTLGVQKLDVASKVRVVSSLSF